MTDRTITLNPSHLVRLQAGQRVWWDDNTGREVLLLPDGADPGEVYDGAHTVTLSPEHVAEIGDPGGLLLLNLTDGGGSVLIRAEGQR